jgi:hypothetical protein
MPAARDMQMLITMRIWEHQPPQSAQTRFSHCCHSGCCRAAAAKRCTRPFRLRRSSPYPMHSMQGRRNEFCTHNPQSLPEASPGAPHRVLHVHDHGHRQQRAQVDGEVEVVEEAVLVLAVLAARRALAMLGAATLPAHLRPERSAPCRRWQPCLRSSQKRSYRAACGAESCSPTFAA